MLVQHLQGWLDIGRSTCVGCGQKRGEDSPMLSCDGCRVARFCLYVYACVCMPVRMHAYVHVQMVAFIHAGMLGRPSPGFPVWWCWCPVPACACACVFVCA